MILDGKGMAEQIIEIKRLYRSEEFQVREKLDLGAVKRYADAYKAGDNFPSVVVALVAGAHILVDGYHRVAALERNGQSTVIADVRKTDRKGALGLAALANLANGLPLVKRKEFHSVFLKYLDAGLYMKGNKLKSSRKIADELGRRITHNTVMSWMLKDRPNIAKLYRLPENGQGSKVSGRNLPRPKNGACEETRVALKAAQVAFQGVTSELERGDLIHEAEGVLQSMKADGKWRYEEPPF